MKRWSFDPTQDVRSYYRKYVPKKDRVKNSWVAPEHARDSTAMERDWPRTDRGEPIRDQRGRVLVIDPRPTIMVPPRPTYQGI